MDAMNSPAPLWLFGALLIVVALGAYWLHGLDTRTDSLEHNDAYRSGFEDRLRGHEKITDAETALLASYNLGWNDADDMLTGRDVAGEGATELDEMPILGFPNDDPRAVISEYRYTGWAK